MELNDDARTPLMAYGRASEVQVKNGSKNPVMSRDDIVRIYTDYAAPVFNFFFYSLGDKEAAEDLTNDVFIKVIGKYDRYDAVKGKFKVWLFSIARNTLKDFLRTRGRHACLSIDEPELSETLASGTDLEEAALRRAKVTELTRALKCLSEREHRIISLKYGAGLRNKDIAKMCLLSEKNVGVILSRAITKLRKQIGDEEHEN